jgi:hypothetical protein
LVADVPIYTLLKLSAATSNVPAPTPEPSKSAPSSDTADTGSSVGKYVGYAVAVILSVISLYYGVYKPLYRFADIKPISLGKYDTVKDTPKGCKECYFINGHFFDWYTDEFIEVEEISVSVKEGSSNFVLPTYYL